MTVVVTLYLGSTIHIYSLFARMMMKALLRKWNKISKRRLLALHVRPAQFDFHCPIPL
jgi:hypothetical protein